MKRSSWMTDGELARAFAAEGSRQAFDELIRRHSGLVYRACRRVTGNHHDAEDAMQAVFAALMEQAAMLTSYRSLAGWLYGTAWNVARRVRRARATRNRYERRVAAAVGADSSSAVGVGDDDLAELYRAIYMLPPDYLDAIVLHHFEGMTIAQVAELTGASAGTTAARVSRGRAMIRERLARRGVVLSTAALSAAFASEASAAATGTPVVHVPAGWVAPVTITASSAAVTTAAGAAGAASTAVATAWSSKWAVAACVALSVGAGTTFLPRDRTPSIKVEPKRTVVAFVTTTASHTAAGSSEAEDEPFLSSRADTRTAPGTGFGPVVPEPASFGVVAIAALIALGRRRR